MKYFVRCAISLLLLAFFFACTSKNPKEVIKVSEVLPWCIIGFDSWDRTPHQRIAMLKEMGITKYGFNKGKGDLSTMLDEFEQAKENHIEIPSIFLWLNANRDSIGGLSAMNRELLSNLGKLDSKPAIWLSFSNNFFEDLDQGQSMELSIEMVKYVKTLADEVGCKLALYNHHGWFGNPHNQVEILEELDEASITMVYNFHHAHEYVDEFPAIAEKIAPYLSYVNLNGVKKEGPQILAIGQGDHELEMIRQLIKEGYNGPWGILGHIKTENVQEVLKRNIDGLTLINNKLNAREEK
nr:TIM barrel protein [Allomuricauda sp.]